MPASSRSRLGKLLVFNLADGCQLTGVPVEAREALNYNGTPSDTGHYEYLVYARGEWLWLCETCYSAREVTHAE